MRAPDIHNVYCRSEAEVIIDECGNELEEFRTWHVSVTHDAWCGHSSCGLDFTVVEFATASEAMAFIANLPTSWENYNA